jgi:3-phosphoshikimate 1-carboxyvinyltransferase
MSDVTYPAELEVVPLAGPPGATVTVPGSKSITNRALVLAALGCAHGCQGCELEGALFSEDTDVMTAALRQLGFYAAPRRDLVAPVMKVFRRESDPGLLFGPDADLFVGNSGTTIRFLTAMLALGRGRYRLDGVPRMRERPIGDLLDALRQLGVDARSEFDNGCPPVVITANGIRGGDVRIKADISSQYLSALLMAAPFADGETVIRVEGPCVSEPYIAMTLEMLDQWGLSVRVEAGPVYRIAGRQRVRSTDGDAKYVAYVIEPDASAASYFWAAAAISGGRVTVSGLDRTSLQGDVRFVDVLARMGCRVEDHEAGTTVHGSALRGVDVDMNDISDTVMTLGAVACFADGPTTIRNVAHIRHKETDRISALATELRKLGADVEERPDGLTITPRPLRGCAVDTYHDHRMAMSLALVGLKVPGVVITNPGCVAKTYPGFWRDLEKLGGRGA